MTLDDLAGKWLSPQNVEEFSLPAIVNFWGMVQAIWGPTGVQNWIFPPLGMASEIGVLYIRRDGRLEPANRSGVRYRWKAYEIAREGAGVASRVRLAAGRPLVIERIRFDFDGTVALSFGGLPRVWRFTDYWNLPPEDVPMFNVEINGDRIIIDDTKTFAVAAIRTEPAPTKIETFAYGEPRHPGKLAFLEFNVKRGDEITWVGELLDSREVSSDKIEKLWDASYWDHTWKSAFTKGNSEFGGHLPVWEGKDPALARLYYMSVLTLLQTRRFIPPATERMSHMTGGQCIYSQKNKPLSRAYVTVGPEGGMTTSFLWDLSLQAPLIARLDPVALREQLEALIRVDMHSHWGVETTSGQGAGMWYGVNDGTFASCVRDYLEATNDYEWLDKEINGRTVFDYVLGCIKGPELSDYGECQNILECVSTYEHKIASFNALNVAAMRFVAGLIDRRRGDSSKLRKDADKLAQAVLSLYHDGHFDCLQPDGSRRCVLTILDFVYVGTCMKEDISPEIRRGMVEFFKSELKTSHWLVALSPRDPDALTKKLPRFQTFRADHQSTGSYDGWPALAAEVLLSFGEKELAREWLCKISELTFEGPFGQAHYVGLTEEDRRSRKPTKASFYNGNCYFEGAGSYFAKVLLNHGEL
jgi:hypothetical protein